MCKQQEVEVLEQKHPPVITADNIHVIINQPDVLRDNLLFSLAKKCQKVNVCSKFWNKKAVISFLIQQIVIISKKGFKFKTKENIQHLKKSL